MPTYEKKMGKINAKDIDLSKIYDTAANASKGLHAVKITDSNQSWKSDKLTYQTLENGTVMISNDGVPIGFTSADILDSIENDNKSVSNKSTQTNLEDVEYNDKEVAEDAPVETPTENVETLEETVDASYETNLTPSEQTMAEDTPAETSSTENPVLDVNVENVDDDIKEDTQGEPTVSQEETPTEEQVIDAKVEDEVAEEIKEDSEEHNEPIHYGEEEPAEKIDTEYEEKTEDLDDNTPELLHQEEAPAEKIDTEYQEQTEELEETSQEETPTEEVPELEAEYEGSSDTTTPYGNPAEKRFADNAEDAKAYNDKIYASLGGRDYCAAANGGTGRCGEQAHDVLVNMGVLKPSYTNHGIDFASKLRHTDLQDGYGYFAHNDVNSSNQRDIFDSIIEDNGGNTGPLIISFNSSGHYRNSGPWGHVLVVTGISDGRVYAIDSSDTAWNGGTTTIDLSVEEFKDHYFSAGGNSMTSANCIVEIK